MLSTIICYSVAVEIALCRHLTYNSRGAWHTLYAMLLSNYLSEMLPKMHTMEKCDFLKSVIDSQIIYFFVKRLKQKAF